ncbi:DNA primase [candidate division TA06 bacterium]|uniref:DNA primase n=1 Tax=candidate division TA06 bacterium TaxID=2250710 RepID=A0A523USL5_UNCT6|nr:MAG: DNA primase [candidate division TA06 bacterium]
MAARLSQEDIDGTREATDIVELLSEYISLKKAGKNYTALCPFHSEKKPSFYVSPERQVYHCFGCGAGGNVYTFLIEMEKLSFPEAVRLLAKKSGIRLKEPDKTSGPREAIYKANEWADDFFFETLAGKESGKRGRDYVKKRQFGKTLIEKFHLGYSPSSWDGLKSAAKSKSEDVLVKAGLLVKSESGRTYDRFRDRLMFPIRNLSGRVVGFGGRSVGDSTPKYMNSPDTAVYRKGNILYGLWEAKQEIRKSGRAIMVEGYTDLLSLRSVGIEEVVASLGTALTDGQAKLLARYTEAVVILFDADTAGDEAAVRSLDILLEHGLDVSVVSLPGGYDPDSFAREKGGEVLLDLIKSPLTFFDFKLGLLKKKYDMSKVRAKADAIKEIASSLVKIPDIVKRDLWVRELSERLSVSEDALIRSMPGSSFKEDLPEASVLPAGPQELELRLLGLMLADSAALSLASESLTIDDFLGTASREVFSKIYELKDDGREVKAADLLSPVTDRDALKAISGSMMVAGPGFDVIKECEGLISKIRKSRIERSMKHKLKEMRDREDRGEDVSRLQKEYQSLIELRRKESVVK